MADYSKSVIEVGTGRPRFDSRSFQLESEDAYNPWARGIGVAVVGTSLYATHRQMLATMPEYAPTLYRWARRFEERSPMQLGKTFGISDRLSSYITPNDLTYTQSMLTNLDGSLNVAGQTFQRQFNAAGVKFDVLKDVTHENPLVFSGRRHGGSGYMQLVGRDGINFETRFTSAEGRLAGAASRFNQSLTNVPLSRSTSPNILRRWSENFGNLRRSQRMSNASPWRETAEIFNDSARFRPFHSRSFAKGSWFENLQQGARDAWSRVGVEALQVMEGPQRGLFSQIGVGLKNGSWNKAMHVPFVGEGGMLNQMLAKRVLPIVAGVTALSWLDYKLGHPSDQLIDLPLKANVLRADLTDKMPGGRKVTDFYEKVVPGPQYGPLALPAAGAFAGGLIHYGKVLAGKFDNANDLRSASARLLPNIGDLRKWAQGGKKLASVEGLGEIWKSLGTPGKGLAIGLAAMLPFVPGMLGSRKTGAELRDIYSGAEPVPVRSGRWWELGSTPYEGSRIKAWRPHWSVLHESRAEDVSLYGSEENKWAHNPFLHPVRWLRDPYWLEKEHYFDRPYPVASPAFSNVPLIGPAAAATIGRLFKPSVRMHEDEWDGKNYTLYSTRIEPKGPEALPPPRLKDEFTLKNVLSREAEQGFEYTGMWGFTAKSFLNAIFPDHNKGKDVYYQGSRQMTSTSRRYYERELGAGLGPSPGFSEHFGYTEPLRRFIQREGFEPQANEIPNEMPSWMPGEDYYTNFRVGDPYVKADQGFARLPGAGYAALHPELKDVNPEDYPDINKMAILADVAPYSREYNTYRQKVGAAAKDNTELQIEYEKILDRVRQTKESVIRMADRHFTAPVEEIDGTVDSVSPGGITLKEFPGRKFGFSSVGMSAADMSARIIGEQNNLTRSEVAKQVDRRRGELRQYLADNLSGEAVHLVVPKGAAENAENIRAVVMAGGTNINQALIDDGYGQYREELGGAEAQAMYGNRAKAFGRLAEGLSFQGDQNAANPMRYLPSPAHTKLWQERTPLAQYINNEVAGTRMRRWERPIHDFLMPYARGIVQRTTGETLVPADVQRRRDLNTLSDVMTYLRELNGQSQGSYTNKGQRTSIGANQFASPTFLASTLPARESHYFREFLSETDPDKRTKILDVVSPEMRRALSAQWTAQKARLAVAEGRDPGPVGEGGREYDDEALAEYEGADTKLDYANWLRSKEIADFFSRTGFTLPDAGSEAYGEALDYTDVQLKIIQQEGYDAHDFNIFDDRAAELWRKPYVDGAVRELTSGDSRSADDLRRSVEQLMLAAHDRKADVRATIHAGRVDHSNVRIHADIDQTEDLLRDMRRHPEEYAEQ